MKTLAELRAECSKLELTVRSAGRPSKEPYIAALRDLYLKRDFPGGLPYQELSPMLCYPYWDLREKEQNALWKDSGWALQEKLNGVRLIIHFVKDLGIFVHSRTISEETFRRSDLTDHLVFRSFIPDFTATIDSELVGPSLVQTVALVHGEAEESLRQQQATPLTVHVFDCVNWQGSDLRAKPLRERLVALAEFEKAIATTQLSKHFAFPAVTTTEKQEAFENLLGTGCEGAVLKRLASFYEEGSRSRRGWIKLKKQLVFDSYVSGFLPGRVGSKWEQVVGALDFSVRTETGHRLIARISNLDWNLRKSVSVWDHATRKVKLDLDTYGRVAKVSGLEMSARAFRLSHPKIVSWLPDLKQEACSYAKSDLDRLRRGEIFQPLRRATTKD